MVTSFSYRCILPYFIAVPVRGVQGLIEGPKPFNEASSRRADHTDNHPDSHLQLAISCGSLVDLHVSSLVSNWQEERVHTKQKQALLNGPKG